MVLSSADKDMLTAADWVLAKAGGDKGTGEEY